MFQASIPFFLRKVDGDEVRTAARGVHAQTQADGKAVDDAAENADEERVVGDDAGRDDVGEYAGKHDHQARIQGELFADVTEPYVDRDHVEQKVDHGERQMKVQEAFREALNENGETGSSSGIKTAGLYEGVDVERHEQ